MRRLQIGFLSWVLCMVAGCAHEVTWLGDPPEPLARSGEPALMTVAVALRSFEAKGVTERGLFERYIQELREANLFQGVMHPIPEGARPAWELQVLVRDELIPAPGNFWREFWAAAIPPLGFTIWMETEYRLELETLLTRRGEIVRSYATEGRILNRYQTSADPLALERDGLEVVVSHTIHQTLAALQRDLPEIRRLNAE